MSLTIMTPGLMDYREAWDLQKRIHADRTEGRCGDTLILLEHPPVYTLGRNADAEHILADESWLEEAGIDVVQSDRGGDVTYHGPGQLVGYPLVSLEDRAVSVRRFVSVIEETLIAVLKEFDIAGATHPEYPGVWTGQNKIAALGLRIHRQVTMHGFALNVCPDLQHYQGIVACGIADRGVTSMALECGRPVSVEDVIPVAIREFQARMAGVWDG